MSNRFAPGTFAPAPRPAPLPAMLAAQTRMELLLLIRNGEQLLLTLFIPVTLLIGLSLLPLTTDAGDTTAARVTTFVPAIMAVAIMSTAFTGQAIAVGFDRRYGALKRLGATPIPRWGIIAGKSFAVVIVVAGQAVIIGLIALALGWRPSAAGLAIGILVIALGTLAFAALGLLLGGTLKAEVVLALGNLIWFVLLAFAGLVVYDDKVPGAVKILARCTPSGALTEALTRATAHSSFDVAGIVVLLLWAAVGGALAIRWFKFE
ncbi:MULTISPECIES: ABC transporter permease [unclassified Gordonia (in: high G+C Gram-positive bacteria)]|uniref:ABC transporter permease n=1 Tax=unclassified Gordonia (in: high G+C Gram-positive bacteria) TaxID=2657482 RepID=UPI001FFFAA63|nr:MULTISPECIES: ABC transporter permease [unclassified Gordonia (in: high G+C Gram-positive bacteria)]UQE76896.1 ABC transporter permease [Gordonia sp. PP30]